MTEESRPLTVRDDDTGIQSVVENPRFILEQKKAILTLLTGRTSPSDVRKRPTRGGGESNYVNGYFMFRQMSLITGFRWSHEALETKFRPDEKNPIEIGVFVKVKYWDKNGKEYYQTSWGSKDVARYTKDDKYGHYKAGDIISLFDDLKAAETDAIKKALSYFGIANDIYGGKELQFFGEEAAEDLNQSNGAGTTGQVQVFSSTDAYKAFGNWLAQNKVRWSEAFQILATNVERYKEEYKNKGSISITDYKEAFEIIKKERGL